MSNKNEIIRFVCALGVYGDGFYVYSQLWRCPKPFKIWRHMMQ